MSPFALAVQRRRWPLVALYLLIGAAEVAAELAPPEHDVLLEALDVAGR